MAEMQTMDPEMESMYEREGPGASKPKGESEENTETVDQEKQEETADTDIISNKVLSPEGEPLKPGDEIVVQVVSVHGDQSLVRYAPKKKTSTEESEPDKEIESLDRGAY